MTHQTLRLGALALALAALAGGLQGCAVGAVSAVAGTVLLATDRRTTGTVVEDETIELRSALRLNEALGERAHVNVTSYNRHALLTGEVANEDDKKRAEAVVKAVDNVQRVSNELAVMGLTTLGQRSADTLVTTRVKAAFVDARDLVAQSIKVSTERGVVYLFGRVTQREADRATQITRTTQGALRVVSLFEIISEEELARLQPKPAPAPAPQ
jgi:osmotically-inducible protein OsmY